VTEDGEDPENRDPRPETREPKTENGHFVSIISVVGRFGHLCELRARHFAHIFV